MKAPGAGAASIREEWSVTLDGRYLVRFSGANARELATRQLHELAELLGFEETDRTDGAAVSPEETARLQRR